MLEKAREIIELVKKQMSGEISTEEQAKLDAFASRSAENASLVQLMSSEEGIQFILAQYEMDRKVWENEQGSWQQQTPVVNLPTQHPQKRRKLLYYIAAAMMAFAIITASLYFLFPIASPVKKSITSHQQQPDLPPGQRRAMLFLADQSSIVLDSAGTGEIARQGNTAITKSNDGTLQYEKSGGNMNAGTNMLVTPRGGYYTLTLTDGTKVWVNAHSKLTYPVSFTGHERRVWLQGEAYFEVAKDITKPFYVETENGNIIEVTGTKFNVSSYSDDLSETISLLEGSVTVSTSRSITDLRPGQQAMIITSDKKMTVAEGNVNTAIYWIMGYFSFDEAGLDNVMRQISRWYDVNVIFSGEVSQNRLRGKVSRGMNLSQLLVTLEKMGLAKFKLDEKTITVMPL